VFSVVPGNAAYDNHRDTETTEVAQRRTQTRAVPMIFKIDRINKIIEIEWQE